jgi:hypothetical protein
MLALLKLIPFRDYIYGAIIATLLVLIGICKHDHTVVQESQTGWSCRGEGRKG